MKIDIDKLVNKLIEVHGEKYIYDMSIDKDYKINIFCKKCEKWFVQNIYKHKNGHSCTNCFGGVVLTKEEFIKKSIGRNGNNCDYSNIIYNNSKTKVKLVCKIHNFIFYQTPNNHLSDSVPIEGCKGCPVCSKNTKLTNDEFIKRSTKIHGGKYDYSNVKYINQRDRVKIKYRERNYWFSQSPSNHIYSSKEGCNKCKKSPDYDTEIFIFKARKKHGDRYLYDKVLFTGRENDVTIGCKKHGYFKVKPFTHIVGTKCPKCSASLGEERLMEYFISKNIYFEKEKTFDGCVDKSLLQFDFYLPDYNLIVEYDGQQHYIAVKNWGGANKLNDTIRKDNIKNKYCQYNNIKLIRIPYWDFDNIESLVKMSLINNEN